MADEPPQPAAPVVNPYGLAVARMGARAGPNGMANGANGSAAAGATVGVNPPVKFDYTNPQAYFDQQRRAQQAAAQASGQTGQPGQVNQTQPQVHQPVSGQQRLADCGGWFRQRGAAAAAEQRADVRRRHDDRAGRGADAAARAASAAGGNFNPYNMSGYQPPANSGQAPPATPVEPDRSKYANPYVPTRTP